MQAGVSKVQRVQQPGPQDAGKAVTAAPGNLHDAGLRVTSHGDCMSILWTRELGTALGMYIRKTDEMNIGSRANDNNNLQGRRPYVPSRVRRPA